MDTVPFNYKEQGAVIWEHAVLWVVVVSQPPSRACPCKYGWNPWQWCPSSYLIPISLNTKTTSSWLVILHEVLRVGNGPREDALGGRGTNPAVCLAGLLCPLCGPQGPPLQGADHIRVRGRSNLQISGLGAACSPMGIKDL